MSDFWALWSSIRLPSKDYLNMGTVVPQGWLLTKMAPEWHMGVGISNMNLLDKAVIQMQDGFEYYHHTDAPTIQNSMQLKLYSLFL